MADRLLDKDPGLFARAVGPQQRHEGGLARLGILAQGLAGQFLVPFVVEQIVRDLKGQAYIVRIMAQRAPSLGR